MCGNIVNYLKEAAPLGSLHAAEVNSGSGSGQNYKRRFSILDLRPQPDLGSPRICTVLYLFVSNE